MKKAILAVSMFLFVVAANAQQDSKMATRLQALLLLFRTTKMLLILNSMLKNLTSEQLSRVKKYPMTSILPT